MEKIIIVIYHAELRNRNIKTRLAHRLLPNDVIDIEFDNKKFTVCVTKVFSHFSFDFINTNTTDIPLEADNVTITFKS